MGWAGMNAIRELKAKLTALINEKASKDLSDVTGTLPLTKGGTGATTASAARTALGLGSAAVKGTASSIAVGSTSTNLPTAAAVAQFVADNAGGGGGGSYEKSDVSVTIAASGWNSSTGVYSFESTYPSSTYDILDILPIDGTTTDSMKSAWSAADCYGYNATNIIKAKGTIPTIDLTMKMILLKKG